jgi:hypothetical protein
MRQQQQQQHRTDITRMTIMLVAYGLPSIACTARSQHTHPRTNGHTASKVFINPTAVFTPPAASYTINTVQHRVPLMMTYADISCCSLYGSSGYIDLVSFNAKAGRLTSINPSSDSSRSISDGRASYT